MSSRWKKLSKCVELTQTHSSGTLHGCEECRSTALRQKWARELVAKGLVRNSQPVTCGTCLATWVVTFGGDAAGYATVSFTVPVLS